MAYAASDPNQQDPNAQDKQPSDSSQGPAQPVNVSGSDASGAGAAPSANQGAQSQATPQGTSSGRFQNIQNYLKANAGYNQGQGLSGQVGSNLTGQEQQQEQAIGQSAQGIQSQAQSAANPYQQGNINQFLQQSLADPTKVNQAQWQQYYQGQYAKPQGFDTSGQLAQQQQQFQQLAGQTGTESGRMALLQNLYGTPGYSTGQQNLDQLLMQAQPGQLGQLQQQAGQLSSQLGQAYSTGQQQSQDALANLASQAAAGAQQLQQGLTKDISQEQAGLTQKAADLQAQRQAQFNALQSGLQSNNLSPDQLAQLGLTKGSETFNVDPTKFLTNQVGQVGVGNVATAADQAKFQALAQMAGQPVNSALGQFANVTGPLAGPGGFDLNAYNAAVNQAGQAFNKQYQDALAQQGQGYNQAKTQLELGTMLNNPQALQMASFSPLGTAGIQQGFSSLEGPAFQSSGDINKDIAALSSDIQSRQGMTPHNAPLNMQQLATQQAENPFITQDQATLQALNAIMNQYSPSRTLQ